VQSVLLRPQGLRSGPYAPTCPLYSATVCKILYTTVFQITVAYIFSVRLQSFVFVLTSKVQHCSFNQTTTDTYHKNLSYNTIYCYQRELTEKKQVQ